MKYKFSLILIGLFSCLNAQLSYMILNNYSIHDYKGIIIATGLNSCYPTVANTYYPEPTYERLLVPSGSTANIGYYYTGLVPYWDLQTSANNPVIIRPYNHFSLSPNPPAIISSSTDWHFSKFEMYIAGTNTAAPNTTCNISSGTNACYSWPSYHYNPISGLEAEWFTIGNYSYLQIY